MSSIRNEHPDMAYRRFGKTDRQLSVITLGGMRFPHGWEDPRDEIPDDMLEVASQTTQAALDCGINHIETAYGYKKSEHCYGLVLNDVLKIPRDRYHLMTKGNPATASDVRRTVEEQLQGLKVDHIDLYGYHGINTPEITANACAKGGPVEELLKMKDEGIIGDVGFSTHGPLEVLIETIATGLFSFMNLHYYYFWQRNQGAVDYAASKDMGIFIISPNDKGGRLFEASDKLKGLTAPFTPIQWNAKWCLANPVIHTLSFGLNEPAHFEEMKGIFPISAPLKDEALAAQKRMDNALYDDPESFYEGFDIHPQESKINVPEILRVRRIWKAYGHPAWGEFRYNMFNPDSHWFPGNQATAEVLDSLDLSNSNTELDIKGLLTETNERFYKEKPKK